MAPAARNPDASLALTFLRKTAGTESAHTLNKRNIIHPVIFKNGATVL